MTYRRNACVSASVLLISKENTYKENQQLIGTSGNPQSQHQRRTRAAHTSLPAIVVNGVSSPSACAIAIAIAVYEKRTATSVHRETASSCAESAVPYFARARLPRQQDRTSGDVAFVDHLVHDPSSFPRIFLADHPLRDAARFETVIKTEPADVRVRADALDARDVLDLGLGFHGRRLCIQRTERIHSLAKIRTLAVVVSSGYRWIAHHVAGVMDALGGCWRARKSVFKSVGTTAKRKRRASRSSQRVFFLSFCVSEACPKALEEVGGKDALVQSGLDQVRRHTPTRAPQSNSTKSMLSFQDQERSVSTRLENTSFESDVICV